MPCSRVSSQHSLLTFEMQEERFLFELLCRDNEFCNGFPVLFIALGSWQITSELLQSGLGYNRVCCIA